MGKRIVKKIKNIIKLNFTRFIYSVPSILSFISSNRIEIIFSTFPNVSVILILLKYLKIINCKIIVRQPNIIEKSLRGSFKLNLLREAYKRLIKFADAIIVTSEFMRNEALKYKVSKKFF